MSALDELSTLPARRRWVNSITQRVVGLGGAVAIGAIALIFIYLLWVVAPLLAGASIESGRQFALSDERPLFLEANESGDIGLRISAAGNALFFAMDDGSTIAESQLAQSINHILQLQL